MKEFCIKHPIITFLIADELITSVYNCVILAMDCSPIFKKDGVIERSCKLVKKKVDQYSKGEKIPEPEPEDKVEMGFH